MIPGGFDPVSAETESAALLRLCCVGVRGLKWSDVIFEYGASGASENQVANTSD